MDEQTAKHMGTLELLGRTIDNLSALVEKQMQLAMLEIREDLASLLRGSGILALGLASLLLMTVALVLAGIMALSLLMPGWLAALIFAAVFFAIGGILALVGLSRLRIRPLETTIETMREDASWLRRWLRSSEK